MSELPAFSELFKKITDRGESVHIWPFEHGIEISRKKELIRGKAIAERMIITLEEMAFSRVDLVFETLLRFSDTPLEQAEDVRPRDLVDEFLARRDIRRRD